VITITKRWMIVSAALVGIGTEECENVIFWLTGK
jgi:hypothetical protein